MPHAPPDPAHGSRRRVGATAGCVALWARPPSTPPHLPPSWASATRRSPVAAARPKPRSPSPTSSWSSSHWRLLADPATRFTDLGPGYHLARLDTDRKLRNHIRQIEALGFTVA